MLLWANKNEIDMKITGPIETMYSKMLKINNLREKLKTWDLSVIFRQIRRHFGYRRDISILDFGAGVCPFGAYLNHIGYRYVTCLDLVNGWHPKIGQETYNENFNARVKYIKINNISDYDKEHDVIFSTSVLEHLGPKERINHLRILSKCLKSGGLFIHVVDYEEGRNLKRLIDNCGIPISYKPEETPGCEEFKHPPKHTWMFIEGTHVAFFNEKEGK